MIRAILIDDERPALRELQYLLKEDGCFEVAGMFVNPLEALANIYLLQPQVVFLDINMPQLKGIDVASKILDTCPLTEMIFVTAYDQYAVEAFELEALDYILKPVSPKRFVKTLNRIKEKIGQNVPQITGKKFKIKCLGKFEAGWNEQEPIKWRSEKTKELFAFLLHHADNEVTKEKILESVWHETDIERASHQLYNGIYYIRKALEQYGVDGTQLTVGGSYLLKLGEAEVDLIRFKSYLEIIQKEECRLETLEKAIGFYRGDYFEGVDWMWADLEREKLIQNYIEVVMKLSERYIQIKNFSQAEALLLNAYQKNPYMAVITKLLLQIYKYTNNRNKALSHFREYAEILKKELGVEPEDDLKGIISKF